VYHRFRGQIIKKNSLACKEFAIARSPARYSTPLHSAVDVHIGHIRFWQWRFNMPDWPETSTSLCSVADPSLQNGAADICFQFSSFHGRPQAWARGGTCPPSSSRNVVKCFCTLVVTAKRSVDELFTHYFDNLTSASRGFAPIDPHWGSIPGPCWGLSSPYP